MKLGSNVCSQPHHATKLLKETIGNVTGLAAQVSYHFQEKRHQTVKLQAWIQSLSENNMLVSIPSGLTRGKLVSSRSCLKYQISLHLQYRAYIACLLLCSASNSAHRTPSIFLRFLELPLSCKPGHFLDNKWST